MKNNFKIILLLSLLAVAYSCNNSGNENKATTTEDTSNESMEMDTTGSNGMAVQNATVTKTEIGADIDCLEPTGTPYSKCVVMDGAQNGSLTGEDFQFCFQVVNNNTYPVVVKSVSLVINQTGYQSNCTPNVPSDVTIPAGGGKAMYSYPYCLPSVKTIGSDYPVVIGLDLKSQPGQPVNFNLTTCTSSTDACCQ